jgi:hypothetical protein
MVAGALVRRRELTGITIDAPMIRTAIGDTTALARLNQISVTLSDPPLTVHRIAGRIALVGQAAHAELPVVAVGASALHASGRVDWSAAGLPAIDALVVADTLAFADVAPLVSNVPSTGGGAFQLAIQTAGGRSGMEYRITSANLHTTQSAIRGDLTIRLDSANTVGIDDVALDLDPVHTDLLRVLAGDAIPRALRGALTARVVAHAGTSARALRIDTLAARYRDEAVPGSSSRVTGHGSVTLGGADGIAFSRLVLSADPVDARTVAHVVPQLAPLSGHLTGTVTLDSALQRLRITGADLRYSERGAPPARVTGRASVNLRDAPEFDVALDARPFAPAALARTAPGLATLPNLDGHIEARGTAQDVSFSVRGRTVGGSLALVGRYRDAPTGVALRVTGNVRGANPRLATPDGRLPNGQVDADMDVDLSGPSASSLRGTATVSMLSGTVGGITIEPSAARVALTESTVVADSVIIATSSGIMRAHGALGLRSPVRDTMAVTASLSLAGLAPLLRAAGVGHSVVGDSARTREPGVLDSLGGEVTARVRMIGSLDSLDADADIEGRDVTSPAFKTPRVRATATVAGIRSRPRGRVSVHVDSVSAGTMRFAAVTADASSDDGERWRVSLGSAGTDNPGGNAHAVVSVRGDTVAIQLDSLAVQLPATRLHLVRPARFERDGSGAITLDTLELRGARGTLLALSGAYRDTGAIALALDMRDAPVFVPASTSPGDSLRVLLNAAVRVEGTARVPRGTARVLARVAPLDSIKVPGALDSLVADVAYADEHARVSVDVHSGTRSVVVARVDGPVQLSLSPFKTELVDEPLTGRLSIDSLALADIASFLPGMRPTAGVLRVGVQLSGTARAPRAVGKASLNAAAARIDALGIEVHGANATLDLASDRVTITNAALRAGKDPEGHAELSGVLGLTDTSRVDVRLRTTTMPVMRLPETADLDVTTDLRLTGPYVKPTLTGEITVDRGVLRLPDMGRAGVVGVDDTAFVRLVDSLAPAPIERATSSPLERVEIGGVRVVMGPNVWIRSAEASVQLGGSIALEHAAPGPDVRDGQIALRGALVTQRGNYRLNIGAFTRSFELERGSVQFTGEPELNPRLDINAVYSRESAENVGASAARAPKVRAHLGGTLELPVLTLSSADAKLSQAELMSYLVTGQASFALGDAANEAMVTGELVATATGALAQRLAGGHFDVVNVTAGATSTDREDTHATAANAFTASRLGLGKQLTNRVFLKVDAGLCALTSGTTSSDLGQTLGVSLDYQFNRRLLGSVSSAPSTNGASCANQAAGRGTALTPRQWGLDFDRAWRF